MTKEQFQLKKAQTRHENIVAYQREIPCVHKIAVQQWEGQVERYNTKDFKSAERVVTAIVNQTGMRSLTGGSAKIIHQLHLMRNR